MIPNYWLLTPLQAHFDDFAHRNMDVLPLPIDSSGWYQVSFDLESIGLRKWILYEKSVKNVKNCKNVKNVKICKNVKNVKIVKNCKKNVKNEQKMWKMWWVLEY